VAISRIVHTRRGFLKRLAASAPVVVSARAWGGAGAVRPGNRITLGFIGTGSQGVEANLAMFIQQADAQVVALCDVDSQRLRGAEETTNRYYAKTTRSGAYSGCLTTTDWREIVARDDIDAVVVSTPDHWHVIPSVAAAKAGKDVFCEKPLTLTVREGRVLSDTMKRYGRVFQTASENRSKSNFLLACELVRNGRIGKLLKITTELPKGHSVQGGYGANPPAEPVPEGFDFDMWLGPAPEAYYTPARCHWNFRWILDYSGGNLTDWGAHINDIAQWANDSEHTGPVSVEGHGVFPHGMLYNAPTHWEITYEYANGVILVCRSGTPGIRFEGAEGWLCCGWDTIEASSPRLLQEPIGPNEIRLRTCPQREQRDFLDCVKTREDTYAPAETGHRSITISHIGLIAMTLGRKLRWDPDRERFVNDVQANLMLDRPKRAPWTIG